MRCLIIIVFILLTTGNVAAAEEDIHWSEPEEITLYWGEEVNSSGYIIRADDFSTAGAFDVPYDHVMIAIENDRLEQWSCLLSLNNSDIPDTYTIEDRLKIQALRIVTGNDIPAPYTTLNITVSNKTLPSTTGISWINSTILATRTLSSDIYMDERAYLTTEIINLRGKYLEEVRLNSTLPIQLFPDPDTDINSTFKLAPYGQTSQEFSIKALKPGTYIIPPAQITVKHEGRIYRKYLNASNITIHGPYMNISKNLIIDSNNTDILNIKVTVTNEGDRAAHVHIIDTIPSGSILVKGESEREMVLFPKNVTELEYSIRLQPDNRDILIPDAKVEYCDAKGYTSTASSGKLKYISNKEAEETSQDEDTAQNTTSVTVQQNTPDNENKAMEEEKPSLSDIRSVKDLVDTLMDIVDLALSRI